jgi:hypothetical protein
MPRCNDLSGQIFGRLTALRRIGMTPQQKAIWLCLCSCDGKEIEVVGAHLLSGNTRSCGCLKQEQMHRQGSGSNGFRHGQGSKRLGRSLTYRSFDATVQRVTNPNHRAWRRYGGANPPVQICDGLREFTGFLSVLGERPAGTSLGRFGDINNYSCGRCAQCRANEWELNCEWQTSKQQHAEQKIKRQIAILAA